MEIQTKSWASIIDFYRGLSAFPTMLVLVEEFAESRYAPYVFPYTSHTTLALAQTETVLERQERLLVEATDDGFRMVLTDAAGWVSEAPPKHRGQRSCCREVAPSEGYRTIVRFLQQAGWLEGLRDD